MHVLKTGMHGESNQHMLFQKGNQFEIPYVDALSHIILLPA